MPILSIDNKAVYKFTKRLETFNKTTLPNAIRDTLNLAADDVKQVTMPKRSLVFDRREQNFFKATSHVDYCKKTTNINEMVSAIGFNEKQLIKLKKNNFAVNDLIEQEEGGMIGGRAFIPLPAARQGNTNMGLVIPKFRLTEIRKKYFVDAKKFQGKNNKERFIKAAIFVGKGGFVIGTGIDGTFLFQINNIHRIKGLEGSKVKTGLTVVNKTKLYSVKPHRAVEVKETEFMHKASIDTSKKLEQFYINVAKARFERDLKI